MLAVLLHLQLKKLTTREWAQKALGNVTPGFFSLGYYQIHHHVHRADFVWVHLFQHLLHLLKCWPHCDVVRPALLNELIVKRAKSC